MMEAKQSKKLSGEQERYLDRLVTSATTRYSQFVGNQSSARNARTRNQNKQYEEAVNSFRNFINDNGQKLNCLFRDLGLQKVCDLTIDYDNKFDNKLWLTIITIYHNQNLWLYTFFSFFLCTLCP